MGERFRVNISSVNDFMTCRYRWVCKWVLNRVPRNEARALSFGKLLHLVYEDHALSNDSMDLSIKRQKSKYMAEADVVKMDVSEVNSAMMAIKDLDSYTEVLCQWRDQYPFDIPVLEVEAPFVLVSPYDDSIEFIGRPDRVGVIFGRLFHVQNRSLAQGTNFDLYLRLAKRHLHELVYGFALAKKYEECPYGGTLFNLLRKITYRGKPTKACPEGKILRGIEECLWQGMVNFSHEDLTAGVYRATQWARLMRDTEHEFTHDGNLPLPNERMNGGMYGNMIDPYFEVLQGDISLDDDKFFKDREDTYRSGLEDNGTDRR